MGFSLSRALAGAVVGGAHAAGQVFDAQLAEAAKDRARQEDEARAMRQAQFADELLAQREESKRAYGEAKEKDKRALYSGLVKDGVAALKEEGVNVGGAEGQRRLGQMFVEAGYPEFANTFFDNGQRAQQADDNKELKKIQLANAAATHALARETKIAGHEGRMADNAKIELKRYDSYLDDFDTKNYDENGKVVGTDPTLKHWMANLTGGLASKDPFAANEQVRKLGMVINDIRGENPGASPAKIKALANERLLGPAQPAPVTTAPAAQTKPVQRTPGVFEPTPASTNGSTSSGLMSKTPY